MTTAPLVEYREPWQGQTYTRAGKPGNRAALMGADRGQRDERVLRGAGDEKVSGRRGHQGRTSNRGERRRRVDGDGDGASGDGAVDGRQRWERVARRTRRTAAATLQRGTDGYQRNSPARLHAKVPSCLRKGHHVVVAIQRTSLLSCWGEVAVGSSNGRATHDSDATRGTGTCDAPCQVVLGEGRCPGRRTAPNFSVRAWFRGSKAPADRDGHFVKRSG